ncbi:nuclear transport factor 2 family protein [Mesorhizobium australicum]|uniref:SnoaL-like domain-containing protein n=1 Tax=Mesorhizobium australicum TaxID=536018 RepID=A0A1X7PX44_9HYPH|nr:nuclear transport factor 2 family protein [Mesorhizobium australicum]SMH56847.1 SnoaL-like domain-containing protein [Mesorhizobium australicum]
MTIDLPRPLEDYFAAKNRHDIDTMLAPFAVDAIVRDESRTYTGHAAIRAWMEETTRKYRVTVEPTGAHLDGQNWKVSALVAGDFPGSPATLRYRFSLAHERIAGLEIGA